MGITLQSAGLLAFENSRSKFSGHLLQLGKQCIFFDQKRFARLLDIWNLAYPSAKSSISNGADIDSDLFFRTFKFSENDSLDVSSRDGANKLHDLNQEIPQEWHEQYDVIFDGGTIEHVFDIKQALNNIVSLLKPQGRIVHYCASSNNLGHGFYMFSPTLLFDFYTANGFEVNYCFVMLYSAFFNGQRSSYKILRYDEWNATARGEQFWQKVELFFVATKVQSLAVPVNPIQRVYDPQFATAAKPPLHWVIKQKVKRYIPIPLQKIGSSCLNILLFFPILLWRRRMGYVFVGKVTKAGKVNWCKDRAPLQG